MLLDSKIEKKKMEEEICYFEKVPKFVLIMIFKLCLEAPLTRGIIHQSTIYSCFFFEEFQFFFFGFKI